MKVSEVKIFSCFVVVLITTVFLVGLSQFQGMERMGSWKSGIHTSDRTTHHTYFFNLIDFEEVEYSSLEPAEIDVELKDNIKLDGEGEFHITQKTLSLYGLKGAKINVPFYILYHSLLIAYS